jgi:hypothetical protein
MSQRASGYARRPDEVYPTPPWVTLLLAPYLKRRNITDVWEPAAGNGLLASVLRGEGFRVVETRDNFFSLNEPPKDTDAIVTNPPYGDDRRGAMARDFIRHALAFETRIVAMLLRVDFDSGKTRTDLFRDNPHFAGKITLLDRIKWFPGDSGPSDNHAWFIWNSRHSGQPWLAYAHRKTVGP